MPIDPEILMAGVNMADGTASTGNSVSGIDELITANPRFNKTRFELPPVGLNVDNIGLENFDSQAYQAESNRMSPETKQEISDGVNDLLSAAESGDEEAGYNALAAAALGEDEDRSLEEMTTDYQEFTKLVEQGPAAIEEFVRQALAPDPDDKMESVPEWALPMTVFGLTLQSEPGDWRQAILRARAKTKQTMFKHKQGQKAAKAQVDAAIKEKALNIYTEFQKGKQLTAKDVMGLVKDGVDPKSIDAYKKTGKASDIKMLPVATEKDIDLLLEDFTIESIGDYQDSGDIRDLVRLPTSKGGTLEYLKLFTTDSVQKWKESGTEGQRDDSILKYRNKEGQKALDVEKIAEMAKSYTRESIDKFLVSGLWADLVELEPGSAMTDWGSDTNATQVKQITTMNKRSYLDAIKTKPVQDKVEVLQDYGSLYALTSEKVNVKSAAGDTLKQIIPLRGKLTPKQFAQALELDLAHPDVQVALSVQEIELPNLPVELATKYGALLSAKTKVGQLQDIVNAFPENVTGIWGYAFDTDIARAASDASGITIPISATMSQVISGVLETQLIQEILQEKRFSNEDRKLVKEFVQGRNFKNRDEALLRLGELAALIDRGIKANEGFIKGSYKLPQQPTSIDTGTSDRINDLLRKAKGFTTSQTANDRLDESLGMRRGPERDFTQSYADRRNESRGARRT
jgi:hypothetical protein|tara:strand:+ start:243 stop:2303 length:2061 start_codon:yes stop_codon:yes gene_type:complete